MAVAVSQSATQPCNMANPSESRRLRELYTYFNPQTFFDEVHSDSVVAPDPLLAAQAQLIALRFNTKRALINLADTDTLYRVAEATQTSNLDDLSFARAGLESQWLECRISPGKGSLCERTMKAAFPISGENPFFEVSDLSKDERFADLSCVVGPPYFRYYCGTPLLTDNNAAIGVVCMLDDKPREALSSEGKEFFSAVSRNVMTHLVLKRGGNEGRRAAVMNRCLNAFVTSEFHEELSPPQKPKFENEQISANSSKSSMDHTEDAPKVDSSLSPTPKLPCGGHHPIRCAVGLISEALDLDTSGEVMFLDPVADANDEQRRGSKVDSELAKCSTIASRVGKRSQNTDPSPGDSSPHGLSVKDLKTLIRGHPLGKLWHFGHDNELLSQHSEKNHFVVEFEEATEGGSRADSNIDVNILRSAFPQAITIAFRPFWNAKASRWVAGFAISNSPYRILNSSTDIPYFIAFCNCIGIELGRISADTANKRKGDFIGSISHELRSPLHGILASCEFLQDTDVSSMQQSLLDTVNSCARTLLDTISMVLDYSKINKFERNMQRASESSRTHTRRLPSDRSSADPGLLPNMYGTVDLAAIVEEVMEGAVVGQAFQSFQHADAGDIGAGVRGLYGTHGASAKRHPDSETDVVTGKEKNVEVILSIPVDDWTFVTQPGAFRRIVMNLVGNALKYTKVGSVNVSMDIEDCACIPEKFVSSTGSWKNLKLTISDTGKGISDAYLSSRLFTPFSQEDSLSPGTGLGLSLVQSLLSILEGEINIESSIGSGTTVRVTIPMCRGTNEAEGSSASTPSSNATPASGLLDDSLKALRNGGHRRAGLFQVGHQNDTDADGRETAASMRHKNLQEYFVHWFGFEFYPQWGGDDTVDLIVTYDYDLEILLESLQGRLNTSQSTPILVLCSHTTRQHALQISDAQNLNIEFLWMPYGPYKLARSVRVCLTRQLLHPSSPQQTLERPAARASPLIDGTVSPTPVPIQQGKYKLIRHGDIVANEDSSNAHLVLQELKTLAKTPKPSTNADTRESSGFPFPSANESDPATLRPAANLSPQRSNAKTPTQADVPPLDPAGLLDKFAGPTKPARMSPRVLVVDDNSVNLKLLRTFVAKRNCEHVATASNGLAAADTFRAALDAGTPFDIIFMDLSMPVLDGFGSTRRIRALEQERRLEADEATAFPPAMIIALTGLASDEDQFDAFDAGVDLYMTKPAKFKEIRRLLDSWEDNGEASSRDKLPHGPVVGQKTIDLVAGLSSNGAPG